MIRSLPASRILLAMFFICDGLRNCGFLMLTARPVRAIASMSGLNDSAEAKGSYSVRTATPAFSLDSRSVDTDTKVYLTAESGAFVYYKMAKTELASTATQAMIDSASAFTCQSRPMALRS